MLFIVPKKSDAKNETNEFDFYELIAKLDVERVEFTDLIYKLAEANNIIQRYHLIKTYKEEQKQLK